MIEPAGLLAAATLLAGGTGKGTPTQARLRRAVSSAYYALFHAIARQAADGMVGVRHRNSPRYSTVYRAFEHRHMQEACAALDKATLGSKASKALGTTTVSKDTRDVANAFTELQKRRHWADYSPTGKITRSEARELIKLAETAIDLMSTSALEERRNFFAYLMLPIRA